MLGIVVALFVNSVLSQSPDEIKLNAAVDKALEEVSIGRYIVDDVNWRLSPSWYPLTARLEAADVSFLPGGKLSRVTPSYLFSVDNGTLFQVHLGLEKMTVDYGHFVLKSTLLNLQGNAQYEVLGSTFGVKAYLGKDCHKMKAYIFAPKGKGALKLSSDSWMRWSLENIFNLFNIQLFGIGGHINEKMIGSALKESLSAPLAKALKETLCKDS